MTKKILSLILSVCIFVSSVPLMLIAYAQDADAVVRLSTDSGEITADGWTDDGNGYYSKRFSDGEAVTLPVPTKAGSTFDGWYSEGYVLPAEYSAVEYIETSGTSDQYIDTGFVPDRNTRVDFDGYSQTPEGTLFLARISQSAGLFGIFYQSAANGYCLCYNATKYMTKFLDTTRYTFSQNKNILTVYNTDGSIKYTCNNIAYPSASFSPNVNMYLFARNTNGTLGNASGYKVRCYSCKIWNDGVMAKYFVPCINKQGVSGMYDLINNEFKSNAGGTSSFLTGEKTGKVVFSSDNKKTESITVTAGAEYSFQAHWSVGSYPVTLNTDGGYISDASWSQADSGIYNGIYFYGTPLALPVPTKAGYDFAGWYEDGNAVESITGNEAKAISLKAAWTDHEYIITLDADGGTVSDDTWTANADGKYTGSFSYMDTVNLPVPEYPGRQFEGWYGSESLLPDGYTPVEYISSNGVDKQYIDTGFAPDSNSKVEFTGYTTLAEGTLFMTRTASNSSDRFGIIAQGSGEYRSDYAQQQSSAPKDKVKLGQKYTFTLDNTRYNISDGTSQIYNAAVTSKVFSSKLTMYIFARNTNNTLQYADIQNYCYGCKIWDNGTLVRNYIPCVNPSGEAGLYDFVTRTFTGNAGTGSFIPGDAVTIDKVTGEMTKVTTLKADNSVSFLKAVWSLSKYNITLITDGGTVTDADWNKNTDGSYSSYYEYSAPKSLPVPEKTGYTFNGWYAGDNKIESVIGTEASDLTLRASWTANTYNVTIDADGGTVSDGQWTDNGDGTYSSTFTFGEEKALPTPEKLDYSFTGWFSDGTKYDSININVASDITLKAQWNVQYVAVIGSEKFETLQAAINSAENGDTVSLIHDFSEDEIKVPFRKTITLDPNGCTAQLKQIVNYGNLTVANSAGGCIYTEDYGILNFGNVTADSSVIDGAICDVLNAGKTATVDGVALSNTLQGKGTEAEPYEICTAHDLELMAFMTSFYPETIPAGGTVAYNGNFDGDKGVYTDKVYYKLMNDITLTGRDWTPACFSFRLGYSIMGNPFRGEFDGNGHSVSGLTISTCDNEEEGLGLFGALDGGIIKNLTVKNVHINVPNDRDCGVIVGLVVNNGTVSNCVAGAQDDGSYVCIEDGAGGMVGRIIKNGSVYNCTNYVEFDCIGYNIGGIVGEAYYQGSSYAGNEADKKILSSGTTSMNIIGNRNYGSISSQDTCAGGIIGLADGCVLVKNNTNYGDVFSKKQFAGGIVGTLKDSGTITGNTNYGDVSGGDATGIGGIVGSTRSNLDTDYSYTSALEITYNTVGEL